MISNVKKGSTCRSLRWSKFKKRKLTLRLFDKDSFLWFLFHLFPIMSKNFLVQLKRWWRPSEFSLREHVFIWNTDCNLFLFLWGISMSCSSSMSKYLDENFFFNSVLFSGAALLNRFTKSSEFEGFNGMSCYDHFLDHSPMWCYYQC